MNTQDYIYETGDQVSTDLAAHSGSRSMGFGAKVLVAALGIVAIPLAGFGIGGALSAAPQGQSVSQITQVSGQQSSSATGASNTTSGQAAGVPVGKISFGSGEGADD